MGADIKAAGNTAIIVGVPRLTGAPVAGTDLRATAALAMAGLAAEGQSEISGIEYLDRGYENFVEKLSAVGAQIWRDDVPVASDSSDVVAGSIVSDSPVVVEGGIVNDRLGSASVREKVA